MTKKAQVNVTQMLQNHIDGKSICDFEAANLHENFNITKLT